MSREAIEKLKIDRTATSPRTPGKRPRKTIIAAVAGVLVLAIAFLAADRRGIKVETVTVSQNYPTQSFTLLNASGYVVPQRKAAVASKITGRLEWIGVLEGSRVKSGQIIARLENRDSEALVRQGEASVQSAQAGLEQAQVELSDAELSLNRIRDLVNQGAVSRSDFDSAEARYKRAKAGVKGAEASVRVAVTSLDGLRISYDYSLIKAPFDAVVLTKNADVGDIITPLGAAANAKAAVVTIADLSSMQVEADVSESSLGQVKGGQPCEVTLDALPDRRFRGILQTVVPTADRTKASVMIKVRFIDNDPRILPEMSAKVAILSREATSQDQKPKIVIPPDSIARRDGLDTVFLIDRDRVRQVRVIRGVRIGDFIEVAGVKPGDKLVLRPLEKLKDGKKIILADK